ncbi:MAG TPA: mechanosensitive ion channel protein MscS [Bacteroidales bacterium]|nr:mechanosensitive ion channel protein MscS [Bacteroidales bacterium]
MLFLDIEVPTPAIPPSDSIRAVTENIIQQVQTDPESFWHGVLDSAIHFGLKVLVALVIYLMGAWLIRRIKRLLVRVFERRHTERTLASFICSFVSITLTVMLVIATIGTLGVDTTSFAALLAAGGMAIGMALSGTVQNFAGGIILLVFRPFQAGDFITAQGQSGTVMDVSIFSTKILTIDNRVVVLPNGALSNGTIENVSAQVLRRVEWKVSVSYGVDSNACMDAIRAILLSDKRILTSADERPKNHSRSAVDTAGLTIPDPTVVLSSLNTSDITFYIRAWVRTSDYWDVLYDLNNRFYTELPPQGFPFAYPHMDINILGKN